MRLGMNNDILFNPTIPSWHRTTLLYQSWSRKTCAELLLPPKLMGKPLGLELHVCFGNTQGAQDQRPLTWNQSHVDIISLTQAIFEPKCLSILLKFYTLSYQNNGWLPLNPSISDFHTKLNSCFKSRCGTSVTELHKHTLCTFSIHGIAPRSYQSVQGCSRISWKIVNTEKQAGKKASLFYVFHPRVQKAVEDQHPKSMWNSFCSLSTAKQMVDALRSNRAQQFLKACNPSILSPPPFPPADKQLPPQVSIQRICLAGERCAQ